MYRGTRIIGRAALASLAAVVISCSGATGSEPRGSADGAAAAAAAKVNIDEIFPPGEGRDLVLNNCQNCHTFVPIVILQMDEEAWQRNSLDHRDRVTTLTDDQFTTLYRYLTANFHPGRPVPALPKELLETWTSY